MDNSIPTQYVTHSLPTSAYAPPIIGQGSASSSLGKQINITRVVNGYLVLVNGYKQYIAKTDEDMLTLVKGLLDIE